MRQMKQYKKEFFVSHLPDYSHILTPYRSFYRVPNFVLALRRSGTGRANEQIEINVVRWTEILKAVG